MTWTCFLLVYEYVSIKNAQKSHFDRFKCLLTVDQPELTVNICLCPMIWVSSESLISVLESSGGRGRSVFALTWRMVVRFNFCFPTLGIAGRFSFCVSGLEMPGKCSFISGPEMVGRWRRSVEILNLSNL